MRMKRKHLLPMVLLSVAILSGCITQLQRPAGPPTVGGPVAIGLSVDATSVPGGTPVGVAITVDNGALSDITDVNVSISGWSATGMPDSQSAGVISSLFSQDFVFTPTTPAVTVDTPYTVFASVDYDMTTSKSLTATVVSYQYYKRTGTKSTITPSPVENGGPIKIDFYDIAKVPYLYGTSATVPIKVAITNVGGGKAYTGTPEVGGTETGLNWITVTVTGLNCPNLPASGRVYLRDGQTAYLSCTLTVTGGLDVQTASATVGASFGYIVDMQSPTIMVTAV
jgi:hypothetical protein